LDIKIVKYRLIGGKIHRHFDINTNDLFIAFIERKDSKPIPPRIEFTPADPQLIIPQSVDIRKPYRILCLDGGGVRGALTAVILHRIVRHHPNFLKEIDFICGTSAGGLISLLLASGYSPEECCEIYMYAAPHIFGHNPWRIINPSRSRYSDKSKQELMQYYFGNRRMKDLKMTAAVIAFRLDGRKSKTHSFFNQEGWRPAVFSNMPRADSMVEPDDDLLVWEAAMRTSAAPTFFPVFQGYTDGGIVANNPSILAVTKAMAHYPHVNTKNVSVLSIGAGNFPRHTDIFSSIHEERDAPLVIPGQVGSSSQSDGGPLAHADWGIRQWVPFLLDILLDGESVTTELVMHYLLGKYIILLLFQFQVFTRTNLSYCTYYLNMH
jgi:predicted acylesterase/phospholipase RssA